MFGTIMRLKAKPGSAQALIDLMDEWVVERGPSTGQVGSHLFKLENTEDEYMAVAIFRDRETYYANAADPETDRRYRALLELLTTEPEWNDGEVIEPSTPFAV